MGVSVSCVSLLLSSQFLRERFWSVYQYGLGRSSIHGYLASWLIDPSQLFCQLLLQGEGMV